MVLLYRAFKSDYPWPNDLVWNGLSAKLDGFQSWLLDERSADPQSPFFKVFDGFATLVDDLEAVVARWIMRCGDHDSGLEMARLCQMRQGRRGADTKTVHMYAERHRSGSNGGRKHVAMHPCS